MEARTLPTLQQRRSLGYLCIVKNLVCRTNSSSPAECYHPHSKGSWGLPVEGKLERLAWDTLYGSLTEGSLSLTCVASRAQLPVGKTDLPENSWQRLPCSLPGLLYRFQAAGLCALHLNFHFYVHIHTSCFCNMHGHAAWPCTWTSSKDKQRDKQHGHAGWIHGYGA